VSYELFILVASIRAMRGGPSTAMSRRAEAVMHALCVVASVVAFAVFFTLCASINASGYDENTESEAYTNANNHASANDDLDDVQPSAAAELLFQAGRDRYDSLVRRMLVTWDIFVGVAVVLWIVLRVLYRATVRELRADAAEVALAEASDAWADTRRSEWEARRQLLEARREAFGEVAKPLEPYILVFVAFAAPALVMSTSFCQNRSGATAYVTERHEGATATFSLGTCDVWCEFALAFRSLATVAVYLVPRERRAELVAVRSTWRNLVKRVKGCFNRRHPSTEYFPVLGSSNNNHSCGDEYEMIALAQQQQQHTESTAGTAHGVNMGASGLPSVGASSIGDARGVIRECDITMVRRLGEGAFGEVWEGEVGGARVAVKIMFAGAVDADGDLIDPSADEDFRKECAALQRVDSPHLIKFFGFGTNESGNGFIVTEMMTGGSLEDVLHDQARDLPWCARVAIGMQVALGMEHLHKRHMLHRDLKSANVLLNETLTMAKVCDFGLSRVVNPIRQRVVHSPFTGVTRLLPRVGLIDISDVKMKTMSMGAGAGADPSVTRRTHSLPTTSTGRNTAQVWIEDARGNMTRAAGTLQWMAPETFRGDQTYTAAVDAYAGPGVNVNRQFWKCPRVTALS